MEEIFLQWLMGVVAYAVRLHDRIQTGKKPETNAGPRFHEAGIHEAFEEGFARWMGWRGEDAQEQEIKQGRKPKGV